MVSILASGPAAPGLIPSIPEIFLEEKLSMLLRRWFEESGQWLENDDRTHLVLASGKPVQKKLIKKSK